MTTSHFLLCIYDYEPLLGNPAFCICKKAVSQVELGGCGGSVVERQTLEREVQGSNPCVVSLSKTL